MSRPVASRLPQDESAALPEPTKGGTIATWFLLLYMWLDLIRPSFVWHFPKFLSAALLVTWLVQPDKRIPRQNLLMVLFLGVMSIDILIAQNAFDAVWTSYGMAVLFLGLCLPLVQFINSIARFKIVMHSLMGIFIVIGAWASFHQGYGPAARDGGQDENYVTACMAMGFPLLLYASFSAETKLKKILYMAPIPILLQAVLVAADASRGGMIGFACTIAYMVYHSKKRMMALVAVGVLVMCVGLMANDTFLDEIGSTTNTDTGTADHRMDLWRIATYMFMSYPLTGIGPNNFRWRISDFETDEIIEKYHHSLGGTAFTHSLYFELLAELGSAGVILFALIAVRNFCDLAEIKRRVRQVMGREASQVCIVEPITRHLPPVGILKFLECYAQGLTASLIAFLVCSAFISTLYYSYFWLYSALIASFKLIVDRVLPQPAGGPDGPMR